MAKKPTVKKFQYTGGGTHVEGDVTYVPGDVIYTQNDLPKMFRNKFTPVAWDAALPMACPGGDEQTKRNADRAAKAGDKLPDPVAPVAGRAANERPADAATGVDTATSGGATLGDNVTAQFSAAKDAGLFVFKDGRKYHVTDADDLTTPLNDTPLSSRVKVVEFIDLLDDTSGEPEPEGVEEEE
jgi:hypothetical protein